MNDVCVGEASRGIVSCYRNVTHDGKLAQAQDSYTFNDAADTHHIVNAERLALMKPTAVMINVGRGAIIDEPALIDALRHQRLRGAALDVFAQEPLPDGHPMYGLDNLLLSPHCADHTRTWIDDAMVFFTGNLERFLRGEPLRNVVEKRLGY